MFVVLAVLVVLTGLALALVLISVTAVVALKRSRDYLLVTALAVSTLAYTWATSPAFTPVDGQGGRADQILALAGALGVALSLLVAAPRLSGAPRSRLALPAAASSSVAIALSMAGSDLFLSGGGYGVDDALWGRRWLAAPGPLHLPLVSAVGLASAIVVHRSIREGAHLGRGERRVAAGALVLVVLGAANDILFVNGVIRSTSMFEYGLAAVNCSMLALLARRTARQHDALDAAVTTQSNELSAALTRAEVAVVEQGRLLAAATTELQAPADEIVRSVAALADRHPALREELGRVTRQATLLQSRVEQLLVGSGVGLELHPSSFDLSALVRDVCERYGAYAGHRGVRISVPQGAAVFVRGDREKLTRVLEVFVWRAIHLAPGGTVGVAVKTSFVAERKLLARVAVSAQCKLEDVGDVPDEDLGRVAMAERLVVALGGDHGMEFRAGGDPITHWFTASIEREVRATSAGTRQSGSAIAVSNVATVASVLVVEDAEVNQLVVAGMLTNLGYRFHIATDGETAVAAASTRDYAVIFMDCQMPKMDGFEATRLIRLAQARRRPYIVAMTAYAMVGDRERCLAAGMDDYLAKPIRLDALAAILEQRAPLSTPGPRRRARVPEIRGVESAFARDLADSVAAITDARREGNHELARFLVGNLRGAAISLAEREIITACDQALRIDDPLPLLELIERRLAAGVVR